MNTLPEAQVTLDDGNNWFPGRWVGGVSLILGPLLLIAATLLRIQFDFFFPAQLQAYAEHPLLIAVAYGAFAAGNVMLCPAVLTLAKVAGTTRPTIAKWAGALVILGLFARTFHAGIDHLAFQLVRQHGAEFAARTVADTYGAYHLFHTLSPAIMFGWIVLAVAAYVSKALGPLRCCALALASALPLGVLKGSTVLSIVAVGGLSIAFVPLGCRILSEGPRPGVRSVFASVLFVFGITVLFYFLGEAG